MTIKPNDVPVLQVCHSTGCDLGEYYISVNYPNTKHTYYLYNDLSIKGVCVDGNKHGWYQTEEHAKAAVIAYHEKENVKVGRLKAKPGLEVIIDGFINNEKMFTAWEVTKEYNSNLNNKSIFHDIVKQFVNKYYEQGNMIGYQRILIKIAEPNPWCYYIPGKHDPESYTGDTKPPLISINGKIIRTP